MVELTDTDSAIFWLQARCFPIKLQPHYKEKLAGVEGIESPLQSRIVVLAKLNYTPV